MRRWWTWIVIVVSSACSTETGDPLELKRVSTFSDSLGLVTGATFGEERSVYVADALMKAVFKIAGGDMHNLFPNGMGPGEVMEPVDVSYDDGVLSVLDRGKGGTSTFLGRDFVAFRPEDFGPGTRYTAGTDEIENPLSTLREGMQTNSCREQDRTYVMSVVDRSTLFVQGQEVLSTEDEVIVPLGLACSDELVVLGYGISGRLYYRFYNAGMEWIGSREFATAEDTDVLGFIFDLEGRTLLTGRSRPLPKVELWTIGY